MKKIEICYPNFSKKAITFTLDDGSLGYDKMTMDIVGPHGIKGTFNLCKTEYEGVSPDELREHYRGFGIADHCKLHPYAFADGEEYCFADHPAEVEERDESLIYPSSKNEGMYLIHLPRGWRSITTPERYIELVDEERRELESVFGEGSVKDFVWPFGEQRSEKIKAYLKANYRSVRKTGCTKDATAFDLPEDMYAWSYNANHLNLLEIAELFESYPDDGRLKMFAFGVHSVDFERGGKWDDLRSFAEKYGDRPEDYWYATVEEIFDYAEAADSLVLTDTGVINPSDTPVYILVDGEGRVVDGGSSLSL